MIIFIYNKSGAGLVSLDLIFEGAGEEGWVGGPEEDGDYAFDVGAVEVEEYPAVGDDIIASTAEGEWEAVVAVVGGVGVSVEVDCLDSLDLVHRIADGFSAAYFDGYLFGGQ